MYENVAVISFLLSIWWLTGHQAVELIGSAAVFFGFCCSSISDRMVEREAARTKPLVHCYRMYWWFFWAKECSFAIYFALHGAWSAIAGCIVFGLYPLWRKYWRYIHPLRLSKSKS